MDVRYAAATLAVAGLSVLATVLAADSPLLYAWWVVVPGAAVGAVVLGVRWHRPAQRRPWVVLIASLTLLWIGWTISASVAAGIVGGAARDVVPVVRDVLYVIAYPTLGAASLLMVRSRTGGRDRDNLIDALIVMAALATVFGAWLFGSGDIGPAVSRLDRVWVTASPLLLAAVVSASLRILFAAGQRLPAAWLLLISSSLTLSGNLWTSQLIRDGSPTQVTGIDVLWVLGFVAVGAATLHPSMREITEPIPAGELLDGMPVDRLALLGAALLSVPLADLQVAGGSLEAVWVAVGGVVVALLAVWRVARLLRERDLARGSLRAAAARDAMIGIIGRWALDDRSTWELLADADELLFDALPGVECTVVPTGSPASRGGEETLVVTRFPVDDGIAPVAELIASSDARRPEALGEYDFLEAVAAVLSAAARRRAAEARLRHDALHDPLTGLPNRTLAVDRLTQLLGRRKATDVTVAFLDLDGFKAINDTYGHDAGDRALRDIADRLIDAVRDDDTVARFAGDEFVVLISNTDRHALERLISRLLAAATTDVTGNGRTLTVSASIGVARGRSGTISAEALLQRADAAMYRAKRDGTGRAVWVVDTAVDLADRADARESSVRAAGA